MTKNSFDKFRDVGSPLSEWTIPAEDGVHRRTIVKGAAWTIPVVAVAVATPAAAASKTPTLAFTQASYSGTACGTITGVQVKRTTDGTTPDAGKTVTVTLKDGYTFANGTTTYSGTTDANGLITLPSITVPAKGGDSSFGATSNTLSASAPVKTPTNTIAGTYGTNGSDQTYPKIPANSTAVGGNYFLAPNGDLYSKDTATPVATGVKSASGYLDSANNQYVAFMTTSGTAKLIGTNGASETYPKIPADSVPVGGNYFLAPNGDLYSKDTATPVATGVKSASGYLDSANNQYVAFMTTSGTAKLIGTNGASETYPKIPADSVPVGGNYFLAPNGDLYSKDTATPVATGVKSASGYLDSANNQYVAFMTTAGTAKVLGTNGTNQTYANIPANSTPVGGNFFLAPNGDLYSGNTANPVETGVKSASGYNDNKDGQYVSYAKDATKC